MSMNHGVICTIFGIKFKNANVQTKIKYNTLQILFDNDYKCKDLKRILSKVVHEVIGNTLQHNLGEITYGDNLQLL